MARCGLSLISLSLVLFVAAQLATTEAKSFDWWQNSVFYQIYVRSFKDSNGDGIGDINGIIQKLSYLQGLGVEAIILSPIFRSQMVDQGYDVADFQNVDPTYGTMDDFQKLIKQAKDRNIKVILDFIPNHSSDQHDWFRKSTRRMSPYTDYYVWRDGRPNPSDYNRPYPPNNWLSRYGGSAWEWSPERHQYYLHSYSARQPDLNYRNPAVVQEMKNALTYWMSKGVDGFRMIGVVNLFESPSFLDEPVATGHVYTYDYSSLNHVYTTNLNDTYNMVVQWRNLLDKYTHDTKSKNPTRILMVETNTDIQHALAYYGNSSHPGAHLPVNQVFLQDLNNQSRAPEFIQAIHKWQDSMYDGRWANWMLGSPEVSRVASRLNPQRVDALNMLYLLLPGTAITYYGEEIGMMDTFLRKDQTRDPMASLGGLQRSRDPARTPFQWDSTNSAGFSTNSFPWLPVNPNFRDLNLQKQERDKRSQYGIYRRLVAARQESTMMKGGMNINTMPSSAVLSFTRTYKDKDTFVVVINFGDITEEINLKSYNLPKSLNVHTASSNSKLKQGDSVSYKKLELPPNSGVVLTTGKVKDYKYNRAGLSVQLSSGLLLTVGAMLPLVYSFFH